MIVHVTQEHIDKAKELLSQRYRVASNCCPVALAIKEAKSESWCVGQTVAWQGLNYGDTWVALPSKAQRFIVRFDSKEEVEPFSFEIDI